VDFPVVIGVENYTIFGANKNCGKLWEGELELEYVRWGRGLSEVSNV
jgi:hypothetical protein